MTSIGLIDNKAIDLIANPQTVTGSWADLGTVLVTGDYEMTALWLDIDINSTQDLQIRVMGSPTEDFASAYNLPIQDVSDPSKVGLQAQIFEISVDADQKIIVPMSIDDAVPFIKVQIQALTPGGTPGQILSAKMSVKTIGRS